MSDTAHQDQTPAAPVSDDLVQQIRALFEQFGCPLLYILKTSKAGQTVEAQLGHEFSLPPYAVIHDGEIEEEGFHLMYQWRRANVDLLYFNKAGCDPSPEALAKELHDRDAYEIVWSRKWGR